MAGKSVKEKEKEMASTKDSKKMEIFRFPTGCTELDCILSEGRGSSEFGYPLSMLMRLNSHSKAGKTRLALEALYSALKFYGKENVEYMYIDAENGMSIDTRSAYGFNLTEDDGTLRHDIETVDSMQVAISEFCKNKDPKKKGVIIVDSLDALPDAEALTKLETRTKQFNKENKVDTIKSYGMTKAKLLSEILSVCNGIVAKNNTHLLVIQQVRTKVGASIFEKDTTTSGGNAPGFYATVTLELKRKESYGPKDRETGYLLEVFGDKTRTKYEKRKAYIAVDHEMGFDCIKSDLIFLYDLLTDIKKLDIPKSAALKWSAEWNPESALKSVESVTSIQYKEFSEEHNIAALLKAEGDKHTVTNIKKYIAKNAKLRNCFIEKYGVMDLDTLCVYIEENELEEELKRRVKDKFFTIEENLRLVKRKSRKL